MAIDPFLKPDLVPLTLERTMHRLVLLRHGESEWNRDQRFTGWADVDLTEVGQAQMREAGRVLRESGIDIDVVVTSVLRRTIHSAWLVLDTMDRCWIPARSDWRLNERHYGALTGMSKPQAILRFGDQKVRAWRRSYAVSPPDVDAQASRFIPLDARYKAVPVNRIPQGESLAQTSLRVQAAWLDIQSEHLQAGQAVLVLSHGNTLRTLMGLLEHLSPQAQASLDVPNGTSFIYELDAQCRVLSKRTLHVDQASPSSIL